MPYANKDADKPVLPCNLICGFVVCCQDSMIPMGAISKFKDLLATVAFFGLTWSQTFKGMFSCDVVRI